MRILTVICSTLLLCGAVWAQSSTAQINGTVRDTSGLAVPGAEIKVTQTATGASRTASSGANGSYTLPNLAIGPYLLEVTKEGFSKYAQTGIVLQVDANPTVDTVLKVGSVSEQVTVEAGAALVETHSTGVGTVVDNQRVEEMPLNGRNPIELVFLAGMASTAGGANNINSVRNYPTVVVSVAGGQGDSINYMLDGASHMDPYNNASLPFPFPDALQEFKVETSALPAQYGYHSGATVNAVTVSGTNKFHGGAFEFLRNGDLNARDFFAVKRDTLKRNQFGGTLGGPVLKDKLFVFGGFQRTSQRSDPAQNIAFVPTAAMVGGDFTAFASAACQGTQRNLAAALGFTGNKIAPSQLNPVALAFVKTLPQPTDPCGRTTYGLVANQDENLWVTRVDFQKSEKNSLFGRFSLGDLNIGSTFDGKNPLSVNQYGSADLDYSFAIGDTYLIGTNIVSSFRASASRTNVVKVSDASKSWQDFGATMSDQGEHVMNTTVSSAFSIGGGSAVPGANHTGVNPGVAEDISMVKGAHQLGFGGGWLFQGVNYWSGISLVAASTFNGSVSGLPLADLMTGQAVTFVQGLRNGYYNRQTYVSAYAQDTWKVNSRLTVNYGLRWEPYMGPYSKFGQLDHFDLGLYNQNFHSSVFTNAPAGLAFPGDKEYACGNNIHCSVWNKFFPRAGLAWDPVGDGRTSIRASYGMFGDRNNFLFYAQMSANAPFADTVNLANVNIANPWATYPGGNPIPSLATRKGIGHADTKSTLPLLAQMITYPLDGYKPPYLNQWNLSVQRQVGTDWLLQVNYVGNSSIHLVSGNLLNPAVYLGLGACNINGTAFSTCSTTTNQNQRRVLNLANPVKAQYYSAMGYLDDGGTGTYDALFMSAQKRLSHGVNLMANYTWSHCISDIFDTKTNATGQHFVDPRRPPGVSKQLRGIGSAASV